MSFFLCSELFAFVSLSSSAISSGAVGAGITVGVTIFLLLQIFERDGEKKEAVEDTR